MASGVKCDAGGLYWASGCGHADASYFSEYDEFPNCKTCGSPIKWIYRKPTMYQEFLRLTFSALDSWRLIVFPAHENFRIR
jgi:hypothetical protein